MNNFTSISVISATARNHICPSLSFSCYISQPILSIENSGLMAVFLIGRGEALNPDDGYWIFPPHLLAFFNIYNGDFEELRAISPKDFGLKDEIDKPLCAGVFPSDKETDAKYLSNQIKLHQSFDKLIVHSLEKTKYESELEIYKRQFKKISEVGLMPYFTKLLL